MNSEEFQLARLRARDAAYQHVLGFVDKPTEDSFERAKESIVGQNHTNQEEVESLYQEYVDEFNRTTELIEMENGNGK